MGLKTIECEAVGVRFEGSQYVIHRPRCSHLRHTGMTLASDNARHDMMQDLASVTRGSQSSRYSHLASWRVRLHVRNTGARAPATYVHSPCPHTSNSLDCYTLMTVGLDDCDPRVTDAKSCIISCLAICHVLHYLMSVSCQCGACGANESNEVGG